MEIPRCDKRDHLIRQYSELVYAFVSGNDGATIDRPKEAWTAFRAHIDDHGCYPVLSLDELRHPKNSKDSLDGPHRSSSEHISHFVRPNNTAPNGLTSLKRRASRKDGGNNTGTSTSLEISLSVLLSPNNFFS